MARTITFIQAVSAGNALRIGLRLPPGASFIRLLRQPTDTFSGPDDASAVVVADQFTGDGVLDTIGLVNGVAVFYRAYVNTNGAWDEPITATAAPGATYADGGPDVQEIVRCRIELGLAVEVARGALIAPKSRNKIQVLTQPVALPDAILYPMVTVHFDRCVPTDRYVGEDVTGVGDDEGFLANTTLNIAAVSQNPDERIALRKALNRILLANFDVFGGLGLMRPVFNLADSEQLPATDQGVVLYMTGGSFSCDHQSYVTADYPIIADVDVFVHPRFGSSN